MGNRLCYWRSSKSVRVSDFIRRSLSGPAITSRHGQTRGVVPSNATVGSFALRARLVSIPLADRIRYVRGYFPDDNSGPAVVIATQPTPGSSKTNGRS